MTSTKATALQLDAVREELARRDIAAMISLDIRRAAPTMSMTKAGAWLGFLRTLPLAADVLDDADARSAREQSGVAALARFSQRLLTEIDGDTVNAIAPSLIAAVLALAEPTGVSAEALLAEARVRAGLADAVLAG